MQLRFSYGITSRGGAFSPLSLLVGATVMPWHDPSDLSTLFQDTAGTTPVAADGDPVALMRDKSGAGVHATQSTAANRPIYRTSGGLSWLEFNGATGNRWLQTASFATGVDKAQIITGARKLSDAAFQSIVEFSPVADSNVGSWCIGCGTTTGDASRRTWASVLTGSVNNIAGVGIFAQPDTRVITALYDLSQAAASGEQTVRLNGVAQTPTFTGANSGTGNFGTYALYFGRRGGASNPFDGRYYGSIVRFSSANLDTSRVASAERWMAARTGVTI